MKLKKELQVKLDWKNNKGYHYGPIANFPLSNGMKADFNLRVAVVENVDDSMTYDLFKIDVEDLKVFMQDNQYIILRGSQEKNLINSIQEKTTW
jgi:hypothetical protein